MVRMRLGVKERWGRKTAENKGAKELTSS
jgi:hypothetical protein